MKKVKNKKRKIKRRKKIKVKPVPTKNQLLGIAMEPIQASQLVSVCSKGFVEIVKDEFTYDEILQTLYCLIDRLNLLKEIKKPLKMNIRIIKIIQSMIKKLENRIPHRIY
jgi:hypothetical protein